jgi:hypothetical protein
MTRLRCRLLGCRPLMIYLPEPHLICRRCWDTPLPGRKR